MKRLRHLLAVASDYTNISRHRGVGKRYHLDIEGFECAAKVNARTDARVGDEVTMAMDVNKIHIFDKDTEEVITN